MTDNKKFKSEVMRLLGAEVGEAVQSKPPRHCGKYMAVIVPVDWDGAGKDSYYRCVKCGRERRP